MIRSGAIDYSKNAKVVRSNVGAKTDRSRYLLPRSHEVSGKNEQA